LVAHEAGGQAAREEVTELLGEAAEGAVHEELQSWMDVRPDIVPIGHSLGGGRAVYSVDQLRRQGVMLNKAVLEAAACFGGVHIFDAPRSVVREMRYMSGRHLGHELAVARDALEYMVATGPWKLGEEIRFASHAKAVERTRRLVNDGVQVSAVSHPDDLLINNLESGNGLRLAGVEDIVEVEAEYAGHNAQLYATRAVFLALQRVIEGMRQPVSRADRETVR